MIRVNKNQDKEVIYEAYKRVLNNLRVQRHANKQHVLHKREIIKEKNKKYNTLSWKYFRMTQVLHGLDLELKKFGGRMMQKKAEGKKIGYQNALKKFDKNNFSINNPYKFISMCDLLTDTIGYSMKDISFILWANNYDFFTKDDFKRDLPQTGVHYYQQIYKFKQNGFLVKISENGRRGIYSLSATGKAMASKINKFINNINGVSRA